MNAAQLDLDRQLASDAKSLAERLRRVVVEIHSPRGAGTGIVWGNTGLIVTNAHCAPRDVSLRIETDSKSWSAECVAYARDYDLALLAGPSLSAPALELRDAASLRIGELVFAHGHPMGIRDSLAMGAVHGVARHPRSGETRFVVADIRLAPGNSGGPLVDAEGRLVGVNSMVVNGLGVAIPALVVQRFVDRAGASRAA
jgi:serine protease Do